MAIPVTIPYSFANATTTQNLSYLDANYNALANGLNGLANGTSQISISSISATGNANVTTYLRGDGSWATVSGGGGSGTVTSINANSSIGFTFTGGPVTSSGTLTLSGPTPGTSGNVLTSDGTNWSSQAGSGLGVGQTWQVVTRTSGTTYYNTTGKPIMFNFSSAINSNANLVVEGVTIARTASASNTYGNFSAIIPPGSSYVLTIDAGSAQYIAELR